MIQCVYVYYYVYVDGRTMQNVDEWTERTNDWACVCALKQRRTYKSRAEKCANTENETKNVFIRLPDSIVCVCVIAICWRYLASSTAALFDNSNVQVHTYFRA